MHETGLSEEIARQHLRNMIDSCWKKMNKEWVNDQHPFAEPFVETDFKSCSDSSMYIPIWRWARSSRWESKEKSSVISC